ncbi:MAG: hypothetical protein JXB48_24200 [Candidatus Latescibacteria bacterium]|nr:hypothetical protein [Candidatus Latescibacterota bacterium]
MRSIMILLFTVCMISSLILNGCTSKSDNADTGTNVPFFGTLQLTITFQQPGVLSKRADISLQKLFIDIYDEQTLYQSDTVTISNNDASISRTYSDIPSLHEYTIFSYTKDIIDSIIHPIDSISVEVQPNKTSNVNLSLEPAYSMLKMTYTTLPDSIKRLTTIIDGNIVGDTTAVTDYFIAGVNVPFSYDYIRIGIRDFRFEARGTIWGIDTLRYAGDTTITINAGQDQSINFELKNLCKTPYYGNLNVEITLIPIGTVTITGSFEQ